MSSRIFLYRFPLLIIFSTLLLSLTNFPSFLPVSPQATSIIFRVTFSDYSYSNYSSFSSAGGNFNSSLLHDVLNVGMGWSAGWFNISSVDSDNVNAPLSLHVGVNPNNGVISPFDIYTAIVSQCAGTTPSSDVCLSNNQFIQDRSNLYVLPLALTVDLLCCDGFSYEVDSPYCPKCSLSHLDYIPIIIGVVVGVVSVTLLFILCLRCKRKYFPSDEEVKKEFHEKQMKIEVEIRSMPPADLQGAPLPQQQGNGRKQSSHAHEDKPMSGNPRNIHVASKHSKDKERKENAEERERKQMDEAIRLSQQEAERQQHRDIQEQQKLFDQHERQRKSSQQGQFQPMMYGNGNGNDR